MFIILSTLAGLIVLRLLYEFKRDHKLPPGPRRLPFIGNIYQVPQVLPWLTFDDWSKKYGPIWSAQFGRQTMIMISDASIASELLDKRGSIYSDRPNMTMANDNVTKGMHILVRHYDDRYRLHQRMEAPVLSPRASSTYLPIQDLESKQLLRDFLSSNDFRKIFDRYSFSLVYALTYGFRLETGNEPEIKSAREVLGNFVYAARPGTWIVDAIPLLNKLPAPFAPWKKEAERLFKIESEQHIRNMNRALTNPPWNWTKEFAASKQAQLMSQVELAYDMGILANAGMETTSSVMQVFVLAAVTQPRFMAVAQEELDRVIGSSRLPDFSDKDSLPYISAIVNETLRWRPILPGGFPHATQQEDTYMGYKIPKGATIIPLFWSMAQSEEHFENPDGFYPERWLGRTGDGFTNWFGYGRRVCTGRHIAMNSLHILIARILWSYDIKPRAGPDGQPEKVDDLKFGSGFVSSPVPFNAVFEPRSHAKEVIGRVWEGVEKDMTILMEGVREKQKAVGLGLRTKK